MGSETERAEGPPPIFYGDPYSFVCGAIKYYRWRLKTHGDRERALEEAKSWLLNGPYSAEVLALAIHDIDSIVGGLLVEVSEAAVGYG